MVYTKFQSPCFLIPEKIFKGFLAYIGLVAILVVEPEPFE